MGLVLLVPLEQVSPSGRVQGQPPGWSASTARWWVEPAERPASSCRSEEAGRAAWEWRLLQPSLTPQFFVKPEQSRGPPARIRRRRACGRVRLDRRLRSPGAERARKTQRQTKI